MAGFVNGIQTLIDIGVNGFSLYELLIYPQNRKWADKRDKNVYFTFPTRLEDCLAIGTIADGVFGDFHYRHPEYAPYLRTSHSGLPGLEGGLRRNQYESQMHPFIVAIQSGYLAQEILSFFQRPSTYDGVPLSRPLAGTGFN